jgi:hypothetical protein
MKPFTVGLAKNLAGHPEIFHTSACRHASRTLTPEAITDIMVWRAFLCVLALDDKPFTRSILSFTARESLVLLEGDASLFGIGAGVRTWPTTSRKWELRAYTAINPLPFEVTDDSSRQNTMELIVGVAGLVLAADLGLGDFTFDFRGDNAAVLSWIKRNRASSSIARRTTSVLHMLLGAIGAIPGNQIHIPGVDNVFYDALSREGCHEWESGIQHLRLLESPKACLH